MNQKKQLMAALMNENELAVNATIVHENESDVNATIVQVCEKGENKNKNKETVGDAQKYVCTDCQKCLKTENILKEHIRNVHSGLWYVCSDVACDKMYKKRGPLSAHTKQKHHRGLMDEEKIGKIDVIHKETTKNFQCETCNQLFTRKSTLKLHKMEIHEETFKSFECYLCRSVYTNYRNMKKHFSSKHT